MTKRCYYGFVPEVYVKQINVILWLLILCLMKRYVDVKKCYKKYSYHFIKKNNQKSCFLSFFAIFAPYCTAAYPAVYLKVTGPQRLEPDY